MGFDEQLAKKIEEALKGKRGIRGIVQKKMFGGLCFLHNGNMLCGVDNKSRLMVRVGPAQYEKALKMKHAKEMDFTGRSLKGMIYVDPEGAKSARDIARWIDIGLNFTKTLPKKK